MKLTIDYGADLDWYVVDANGHIALFCTNGEGFSPEENDEFDNDESIYDWHDSLKDDKGVSEAVKVPNKYWEKVASKGLFAYDFTDNSYEMVASSNNPIKFEDTELIDKNVIKVDFKFEDKKVIKEKDLS